MSSWMSPALEVSLLSQRNNVFRFLPKSISIPLITRHHTPIWWWSSTKGIRYFLHHLPCIPTDLIALLLLSEQNTGLTKSPGSHFLMYLINHRTKCELRSHLYSGGILSVYTRGKNQYTIPHTFWLQCINIISLFTTNEASDNDLSPDHIRLPWLLTQWCFRLRLPYPSCIEP